LGTLNYIDENAFNVDDDTPTTLEEPFSFVSGSFNELGYESAYMSSNMGSMYVYYTITQFALILIFIGWITGRCGSSCVAKRHDKLKKTFLWNFCIRLIFEASLELSFCIGLTWKYGQWNQGNWADDYCTINAMVIAVLLAASPFGIYCFYTRKFGQLREEEFEEKYGAVYEGLMLDKKSMLMFPIFFVLRRIAFAAICMTMYHIPIIQMSMMLLMTLLLIGYLLIEKPFEDPLLNKLEVFNEFTNILGIDIFYVLCDVAKT
jgi:hypothetical protein